MANKPKSKQDKRSFGVYEHDLNKGSAPGENKPTAESNNQALDSYEANTDFVQHDVHAAAIMRNKQVKLGK